MTKASFTAWDVDDVDTIYDIEYEPVSTCPVCCSPHEPSIQDLYHVAQHPVSLNQTQHHVYALYFCPDCRNLFVCKYSALAHPEQEDLLRCINLDETIPSPIGGLPCSNPLDQRSNEFSILYTQSLQAESRKLDRIASLGYGMALDSLLKDYLSKQYPDELHAMQAEPIETLLRRIPDPRFHLLADRFQESSQADMELSKQLIQTMLRFMESEAAFAALLTNA